MLGLSMILNVVLAGIVLFFINSCRTPIHFVGYQFRSLKQPKEIILSNYITDLTEDKYKHFISNNCTYYFHKKSAHYFTVCKKDEDIFFVGTDVRLDELSPESSEEILQKMDLEASERITKIKATLQNLQPAAISGPSFVVYKSHDLENSN